MLVIDITSGRVQDLLDCKQPNDERNDRFTRDQRERRDREAAMFRRHQNGHAFTHVGTGH